jgi:hypothetical protein
MNSNEITESLKELRKNISNIRAEIGDYIQPKIGAILTELPSNFGFTRWQADFNGIKRVTLDLYATGKIVFNFQTKLSDTEKTSLDTSRDFLVPDMKPSVENYYDLFTEGNLDLLVEKIKEHFTKY